MLSIASRLLVIVGFCVILMAAGDGVGPLGMIFYWSIQQFFEPDPDFAWSSAALFMIPLATLLVSIFLRGYLRFFSTVLGIFGSAALAFWFLSQSESKLLTLISMIPFLVFVLLALWASCKEVTHWSSEKIRFQARMAAMNQQHPEK